MVPSSRHAHSRRWLLLPALLIPVVAFSFAASCSKNTAVTEAPDAGKPIEIGVSIALSGDLGASGLPIQNAVRVAEQQINANGGVLGRRVNFKVVDDATDTGSVVAGIVKGMIDEGAVAILGPRGSTQVLSVQDQIAKRQVIEISGSATSPSLSDAQAPINRFLFRTIPPDTLQGKAVAILAINGPSDRVLGDAGVVDSGSSDAGDAGPVQPIINGCAKMAIVHSDDPYGNPFAAATVAEFTKRGGTVVANLPIPSTLQASYAPTINAILAPRPECLVLIMFDPAGDEVVAELRKASSSSLPANFFIIGSDGVYKPTFISNGRLDKTNPMSPTVVEGIYGTNPDPNPETSQYGDFKNLYLTQFALDPGAKDLPGKVATFYDAAILAALAIEQAGTTTDPIKIRDSLVAVSRVGRPFGPAELAEAFVAIRHGEDIDYVGASGPVDFDDYGDVIGNYIIWKVQAGQFVTVDRIKADKLQ